VLIIVESKAMETKTKTGKPIRKDGYLKINVIEGLKAESSTSLLDVIQ
jgi:hypothetical protein